MPSLLDSAIGTSSVAIAVNKITGNPRDAAGAAGYAAWVESVTGSYPAVKKNEYGQAVVAMSADQQALMRNWIESQTIKGIVAPSKEAGAMRIEFGPAMAPLALKYLSLAIAAGFVLGYVIKK